MQVNEHVVKLTGKASIPEALSIGSNYQLKIEGAITARTDSDNHDGSVTALYKMEPVRIEIVTPLGDTIKAKDTRSMSQLFRSLVWKRWKDAASDKDFDEFYEGVMNQAMFEIDGLIDRYERRKG